MQRPRAFVVLLKLECCTHVINASHIARSVLCSIVLGKMMSNTALNFAVYNEISRISQRHSILKLYAIFQGLASLSGSAILFEVILKLEVGTGRQLDRSLGVEFQKHRTRTE